MYTKLNSGNETMPGADFRDVFNPASSSVFIPAPQGPKEMDNRQTPGQPNTDTSKPPFSQCQEDSLKDAARPGRRHYIAETMQNQGASLSYCARKLGLTQEEVLQQLNPESNLTLKQLFDWSEALDVPLAELLPFDSSTSDPIRNRALLLRIMKTARQIQRISHNTPMEYAAATLVAQLLELVPDFASIEAWPSVGKSRASKTDGTSMRRVDSETSRIIENNS